MEYNLNFKITKDIKIAASAFKSSLYNDNNIGSIDTKDPTKIFDELRKLLDRKVDK